MIILLLTLVLNLETGEPIVLKDEFKDSNEYTKFSHGISDQIRARIAEYNEENQAACEIPDTYSVFYKDNDNLIFENETDIHSDAGCGVRISVRLTDLAGKLNGGSVLLR